MIYYARPYSYNPKEATERYTVEAEKLYKITGHFVVCTIPLSCYEMEASDGLEQQVFRVAASMIKDCDVFIYKGDSDGVRYERSIAAENNIPSFQYNEFIKSILDEDGGQRGWYKKNE